MKKALISVAAIVVIFLLIVVIGAKLTSSSVEKKITEGVAAFNKSVAELSKKLGSPTPPVILQTSEFKHYWFSSDVTFKLKDDSGESTKDFNFTVEHGPFPLSRLARLKLKPVAFTAKAKPISIPLGLSSTTLNFATTVDYSNNHFSALKLDPVDIDIPDLVKFNTSAINFTQQCYAKAAQCDGNFNLDELHFVAKDSSNKAEYNLEKLQFNIKNKKVPGFDYLSNIDFSSQLKNYNLSINGNKIINYDNNKSVFTINVADGAVKLVASDKIDKINLLDTDLGNYDANLSMTGINAKLLNSILEKFFNQQLDEINPLFTRLLAQKPVLKIDNLTIKNKDTTTFNLTNELVFTDEINKNYLDQGNLAVSLSNKQIKSILSKSIDLATELSKEQDKAEQTKEIVLDNIDTGVKFLVEKGVLQQKDDEISLTGSFADNLIKLNNLTFKSWDEVNQFFASLDQEKPQFKELSWLDDEEYDDEDEDEDEDDAAPAEDNSDESVPMTD